MNDYLVKNPVVIIIFNRPDCVKEIINSLRTVRPSHILIISDGPRKNVIGEEDLVTMARLEVEKINWPCQIEKNYSSENMGCGLRVNSGLSWVFEKVVQAIILEDDCCPTLDFFRFVDWGLEQYKNDRQIGMICGSNLVDFYKPKDNRNYFSQYISIWGWASWQRVWKSHNTCLNFEDVKVTPTFELNPNILDWWTRFFWSEVIKLAILKSHSIWDFQLQYTFFRNNYLSIIPKKNLVKNIGFGLNATHTKGGPPSYWYKSLAQEKNEILQRIPDKRKLVCFDRDTYFIKTVWGFSKIRAIRLALMNCLRIVSFRVKS